MTEAAGLLDLIYSDPEELKKAERRIRQKAAKESREKKVTSTKTAIAHARKEKFGAPSKLARLYTQVNYPICGHRKILWDDSGWLVVVEGDKGSRKMESAKAEHRGLPPIAIKTKEIDNRLDICEECHEILKRTTVIEGNGAMAMQLLDIEWPQS